MKIKASGRLALIIATGLVACLAGPLPAAAAGSDTAASKSDDATTSQSVRQSSRQGKRHAHRGSSDTADKSDGKKAAGNDGGSVTSAGMPASVANANAELTSTDPAAGDKANAGSANVNTMVAADRIAGTQQPADTSVVASDQLNDVDRALQQQASPAEPQQPAQQQPAPQQAAEQQQPPPAPAQTVAMASAKPAPAQASGESTSLDQTSLIGKIFIGFGALLTVASAARMFMA